MPQIPDGFAQATLVMQGPCLPYGAVVTLGLDVRLGTTDPNQAAISVAGAFTSMFTHLAGQISLTEVRVKYGPQATGPSGTYAPSIISASGDVSAPQAAILVQKHTALGGRHNRGRMYWPGIGEGDVAFGIIGAGQVAAMQGSMNTALSSLDDVLLPAVVLHSDASVPTDITSLNVQTRIATQRRRNRR